jgi:60 kDa SS-A/Ro ribonucleoprotein
MRFNTKNLMQGALSTNLAGGPAHAASGKLELASLMLTSMFQPQFYRKPDAQLARLRELVVNKVEPAFAARAALYARKEAGMRSVTHVAAAELARYVKGQEWMARFLEKVVHRPDDVLEILAYYLATYGRPIPNSLKKGLGRALAKFDEYQLAKYRKSAAELSLVDAVNLLHPPHTEALRKLVKGTLASAETWETRLTQAGQAAKPGDAEALAALKNEAWAQLVKDRKIGYFALLRNLRNILETAPEVLEDAVALLTDERLIHKSLVLPFRYLTALEALEHPECARLPGVSKAMEAISDAVEISLANVPKFPGRTLVALDGSGSMMGRPIKIGALFAAVLAKAGGEGVDVMLFSTGAKYVALNTRDSVLTLAKRLESKVEAAGTDFHVIFKTAHRPYERIIILSDMQAWIGHGTPAKDLAAYRRKHGADPRVFSFDLQGYGTLQFPERNVFALAGFSDKTMDTLATLDKDPGAFLKAIEAVDL